MATKISNRTGKTSKCIHCARKVVEVSVAPDEYVDTYGTEGEVWVDVREGRALCMVDNYGTAHITAEEWGSAQ